MYFFVVDVNLRWTKYSGIKLDTKQFEVDF
jgi:hypothetical protein